MIPIIHKINDVSELDSVPTNFGIEADLRHNRGKIIMDHDVSDQLNPTFFEDFLENYNHKLLVANIKESGIEKKVIEFLSKKNINNFFLLDVEFPFILKNYNKYGQFLSLRFSKYENIMSIKPFISKIKWIWIDTYEAFELDDEIANVLRNFKLCLVSPSRWGNGKMINNYLKMFQDFNLQIEAVMVDKNEEIEI